MDSREKKQCYIGIKVTPSLKDRITEEAAEQKRTESNLLRVIIENYFENKDNLKKIANKK